MSVVNAVKDAQLADKDAHLTSLIIEKHEWKKRIESLEAEVAELRKELRRASVVQTCCVSEGSNNDTADTPHSRATVYNARAAEVVTWNEELIRTVEELQAALIRLEAESKVQVIALTDKVAQLHEENELLICENDALKVRVGDDVLRLRQTKRIELAGERVRMAARVRVAGQQRLEAAEAALMGSHDDTFHVRRWDALLLPQRDVSFVFHFVSGVKFPLNGIEEFIISVYQQFLLHSSTCCHGHRVGFHKDMEVFAFQSPTDALLFAKECHEQLVSLSWPARAESIPFFSTIADEGTVYFKGPRMHTCIYACTPESCVNPVSGAYSFFGPEVVEAARAAIEQAPLGEIGVNDRWVELFCKQSRLRDDRASSELGDATELRKSLGPQWEVVDLPGAHHVVASLLPSALCGRRSVVANALQPSRRYPSLELTDAAEETRMIVRAMKGILEQTVEESEPSSGGARGGGLIMQQMRRRANFLQEAVLEKPEQALNKEKRTDFSEGAAQLLEVFALQQEKQNVIALYQGTERAAAALERDMMESEDRFEITRHKTLDASETAYVCTIDTGDDAIWKRILLKNISDDQFDSIRSTIRSHIHNAAKGHFGFLMNGNYEDVFTYVFREVEQALAFVSEIYIKVNRTGTKYAHTSLGKGRDIFLFRAGVSCGPMSTIYRNLENGMLKCTGPAIRLSGTLCDLAESGEILAMEDVIRAFYSKNENLLDAQYNIVKQGAQFVGKSDVPAVVHSILPKPFAYRRPQLRASGRGPMQRERLHLPLRSVLATLMRRQDELPRQSVLDMMEQQLQRCEAAEAATMSAEDEFEQDNTPTGANHRPVLRNPWLLLSQPQAEEQTGTTAAARRTLVRFKTTEEVEADLIYTPRPIAALTFLYCNVVSIAAIAREVDLAVLQRVWGHYNYIVQRAIRGFDGYVVKTNSSTSYLVAFSDAAAALEAARQIQLDLVNSSWPIELRPLEQTLQVKDQKTGVVLFSGPRAQMAVHVSSQYSWRLVPVAGSPSRRSSRLGAAAQEEGGELDRDSSAIHIAGVGVDEAFILGRHANGGEIRLSRPLLDEVVKRPGGKLLLEQLAMEVVVAPSVIRHVAVSPSGRRVSTSDGTLVEEMEVETNMIAEECVASVPRRLEGRLPLMLHHAGLAAAEDGAFASFSAMGGNTWASSPVKAASPVKASAVGVARRRSTIASQGGTTADEGGLSSALSPSRKETAASGSTALAKAVSLLSDLALQNSWLKDPLESSNALPPAAPMDWGSDEEQSSAEALAAGVQQEAKRIQRSMQAVLALFPSEQRYALAPGVDGGGEASAKELPTLASFTSPQLLPGEEGLGATTSEARRRLLNASSGTARNSVLRRSSVRDEATTCGSTARVAPGGKRAGTAPRRTTNQLPAVRQYLRFMDLSRYLVAVLVNALEIGAEQRLPTPLLPPSLSTAGPIGSSVSKDGRPRLQSGEVASLLPAVPGASSSARGRGLSTSTGGNNTSSTSGDARLLVIKAAGSPRKPFFVNPEKPFQSALDYVDDACRSLAHLSESGGGKAVAIPSAPSSKAKIFPSRSPSRRN